MIILYVPASTKRSLPLRFSDQHFAEKSCRHIWNTPLKWSTAILRKQSVTTLMNRYVDASVKWRWSACWGQFCSLSVVVDVMFYHKQDILCMHWCHTEYSDAENNTYVCMWILQTRRLESLMQCVLTIWSGIGFQRWTNSLFYLVFHNRHHIFQWTNVVCLQYIF
jgi:hypothetical protein